MTSANPALHTARALARAALRPRRAVAAAALAGCCAAVGCQTASQQLAEFRALRGGDSAEVAEDPFGSAETALASAKSAPDGGTGVVSLGGATRTAALDSARTVARPTRVDPRVSPAAGRWQPGDGEDAPAVVRTSRPAVRPGDGSAKVVLAGGAFAASDAPPAVTRVTPAVAEVPAETPAPTAVAPAAATNSPAPAAPKADVDWAAEMDAFAAAAEESATPVAAPETPAATPGPESLAGAFRSVTPQAAAEGPAADEATEELSSAPLWDGGETAEPAEPQDDGWRSRTAPAPAAAEPASAAPAVAPAAAPVEDPFAGL